MSHHLKCFKNHKYEYNSSGFTPSEFMEDFKNYVENVIPKELESCTTRNLDKGIQHRLRLKREFLSFARGCGVDKKELRVLFIKKYLSKLLLNASKHAKILETEKEDKTSKKYIEHKNEMLQYTHKITDVYLIFNKRVRSLRNFSIKRYTRFGLY